VRAGAVTGHGVTWAHVRAAPAALGQTDESVFLTLRSHFLSVTRGGE
jgi:hypothetical protein